jgi:NitT/TauT family transport system ATP-binding protein
MRQSSRYLLVGREDAARPDPVQAAWLYAQMARWGQTSLGKDALRTAMAVFRPDLYDAALGKSARPTVPPPDGFAAFAGPAFDPEDVPGYLASFDVAKRA